MTYRRIIALTAVVLFAVSQRTVLALPKDSQNTALGMIISENQDSEEVKKISEALSNPSARLTPPPDKSLPLVHHFKSSSGIAFPSESETLATRTKLDTAILDKYKQEHGITDDPNSGNIGQLTPEMKEMIARLSEVKRPPELQSCVEDRTIIFDAETGKYGGSAHGETVLFDWVITKAPPPMDTDLAFGIESSVFQYTTDPSDKFSLIMGAETVPCLPYRVRMTEHHVIYYMGLNALKNYDRKDGGELYAGIKARLDQYR